KNPRFTLAKDLKIFESLWKKEELKKTVASRTNTMIKTGLIDEIIYIEKKYTRAPNCMSYIGIVETYEYIDDKLSKE
ncbi:tRNA (adenosine(37)-N6)-dimethylallyltransferase MiaA, partial [Aliarcobacter butzleri]